MIARLVTMQFKPDHLDAFFALFQQYSHQISHFPGCFFLNLIQDAESPNVVSTYSLWESEEDLNHYRNSDLFKTVWPATKVLFEKPAKAKSHLLIFTQPALSKHE